MRALLTPLHTLVSTVPLAIHYVTLSTLFLSWFGAHLVMDYAALLLLVLLVDMLWMQDYGKLRLLGILAVLLLLVCGIGQRACRAAATHYLNTVGHADTTLAMTPARTQKSRGS
jgi:hypothetical protein